MKRGRITCIIALGLALAGVATARGQEAEPTGARPAPVAAPVPKTTPKTVPAAPAPGGSTGAAPETKPAPQAPAAPAVETKAPDASDSNPAPETAPAEPSEKAAPRRARPRRRAARPSPKPIAQAEAKPAEVPAAKPAVVPAAPVAKPPAKPAAKPFLTDYEDPKAQEQNMPLGRVILDLVWKLAVVLAIAYGALYALRGLMVRQGGLPRRKGALRVLESATLAPNRSIHLVRVAGKVIVVGSTPEQITTLTEIDDPDALAKIAAESAPSFAARLDGALADDGQPTAGFTEPDGREPDARASVPNSQTPADVASSVRDSVRHIWDQVQQVRGLRSPKGGPR